MGAEKGSSRLSGVLMAWAEYESRRWFRAIRSKAQQPSGKVDMAGGRWVGRRVTQPSNLVTLCTQP